VTTTALMTHLKAHNWCWDRQALLAIPGIAFMGEGGEIVQTEPRRLMRPLDNLPWPDRTMENQQAYFDAWRAKHGETAMRIVTSRGCPYHCSWCSKAVYGDTFRRRPVTDVVDEMEALVAQYKPDQFWFADDLFTINRKWVGRFCEEVKKRGITTPFYCVGRPETLTEDLVKDLAETGLFRMYVSAESGSQLVLDKMQKGDTVEEIVRGVRMLQRYGVEVGLFVMLGYPGETHQEVKATINMLHDLDADQVLLSVAHPMKGTRFWEEVKDRLSEAPVGGWLWGDAAKMGGRQAFRMDYPWVYYELIQRRVWAELGAKKDRTCGRMWIARRKSLKSQGFRLAARGIASGSDLLWR